MPDRAVTPTVAKTLELGLATLLIAGTLTTLYGGVVPDYRTLAASAERIERAIPPAARYASVDRRVPTPPTIRGRSYRIAADGDRLGLRHPHPAIGGETRLFLPGRVARVEGSWESTETTRVQIRTTGEGLRVRLVGDDG